MSSQSPDAFRSAIEFFFKYLLAPILAGLVLYWLTSPGETPPQPKGEGTNVDGGDRNIKNPGDRKPPALTPAQARQRVGEECVVEFVVESTGVGKTRPVVMLNSEKRWASSSNFTVLLGEKAMEQYERRKVSPSV